MLPHPVYKPAFSLTGGLFRFRFAQGHQFIDVLFLDAVGLCVGQQPAMRNARAVEQRFQFTLFALGHLFWVMRGSAIRVPSVSRYPQCTVIRAE